MFKFSKVSLCRLSSVDRRLFWVCNRAMSMQIMDFSVLCGYRSPADQKELFTRGLSRADGYDKISKHNHKPSLAVDLMPYPDEINGVSVWDDPQRFGVLAGIMLSAAAIEGVKLRWGGDWDGDGNNEDSNFKDLPHFEVLE